MIDHVSADLCALSLGIDFSKFSASSDAYVVVDQLKAQLSGPPAQMDQAVSQQIQAMAGQWMASWRQANDN